MTGALVAALAAGAAVWLLGRGTASRGTRRLQPVPEIVGPKSRSVRLGILVVVGAAGLGVAAFFAGGLPAFCASVALGLIAGTAWRVTATHLANRARSATRSAVVEASEVLSGLLRVGLVPATALSTAASDCTVLASAAAVQRAGGDVAAELRRAALAPGKEGLALLAAGWEVASQTGASMTSTVDSVAVRMRADQAVSRVVTAELSAPRATGRLLGALPFAGVGLGYAFGGNPVDFLLGSPVGNGCALVGVALACGGVLWSERIADAAGVV